MMSKHNCTSIQELVKVMNDKNMLPPYRYNDRVVKEMYINNKTKVVTITYEDGSVEFE